MTFIGFAALALLAAATFQLLVPKTQPTEDQQSAVAANT